MAIKRWLKRTLPHTIVLEIQKYRHLQNLKNISRDSDPDFKGIEKIVAPGDTVFDVGANMGFYTIFLSRLVGNRGTVISVEPVQSTFKLLQHMVNKLHLNNVRCFNMAMSSHAGTVKMEVPVSTSGEEDYYLARIVSEEKESSNRKIVTEVKTIDGIVGEQKLGVSFLKIDVEGHELKCLHGAKSLLEAQKPLILIEVWGNPDDESEEGRKTFVFLRQLGYTPYLWRNEEFHIRKTGELSVNYFFMAEHHEKVIKKLGRENQS